MIKPEQLCMGCLADKGAAQVCPACGWRETAQPEATLYLPPRTVLQGQYLIGRVLGHGGFGITYLAWDLNLLQKLAIKEYLPQQLAVRSSDQMTVRVPSGQSQVAFEHGLDKFLDEARTLARFQGHSGIVSVLNFFREHGTGYMVMPFVEGLTLQEYLNQHRGRLPYETTVNILMPVMDALRAVHQVGLLHRDVSPDNIYLTCDNQVMLLDFGAARYAVGEQSNSLSVILKPGYAPEEQYRRHGQQGPWTDVYAVAATMYHTITGHVPVDSLDRLADDNLEPPSRLGAHLPQAAEQALLKAMAVRPPDRYQTMTEFQTALISGNAAGLRPASSLTSAQAQQHTSQAGKAKTALWKTVLPVLALLVVGFAVYFYYASEADLERQQAERRALAEAQAQAEQRVLEQERIRQRAEQELALQQAERRALEAELARQQAERRALEEQQATPLPSRDQTEVPILRPALPPGIPFERLQERLGEPDRITSGLWNTTAWIYDNFHLSYLVDRQTGRIRQSEIVFPITASFEEITNAVFNMTNTTSIPREVLKRIRAVYDGQQEKTRISLGIFYVQLERQDNDRFYLGVWDKNLKK